MSHKKGGSARRHKKKTDKLLKNKDSDGRKKFALKKRFNRLTVKQERNIKRGRDGHTPRMPKLLKDDKNR